MKRCLSPGVIVSCLVLLSLSVKPIRSYALPAEAQVQSFSAADLVKERHLFKRLLSRIDDTTNRQKFEEIIRKELVPQKTISIGNGKLVSIYGAGYPEINYRYGFSYSEETSKNATSFSLIAHFSISDEASFHDDKCLSLNDVRLFSQAGGWVVSPTFAGWMRHGFRGEKGRLLLEANAVGGTGERVLSDSDMTEWLKNNGDGCVSEIRVQQIN